MRLTSLSVLFFLIVFASDINAQNTVKYGNDYLSIGVGARAHGMGKAMIANSSEGNSGYWNPAGLVRNSSGFQVNLMHAEWFAGVAKYDYFSIANLLGKEKKSALGVSIIRLGIDDIPNTFNLVGTDGSINPDLVTGFSYADYAGILSYSQKLGVEGLTLGANAKVIRRTAGKFGQAWGFGLDLGAQYYKNRWQLGLMLRDITSTFNAWSFSYTEEELDVLIATGNEPSKNSVELINPTIILGAAFNSRRTGEEKIGVLIEADFYATTDGKRNTLISSDALSIDPAIGFEFDYKQLVYLRGGIGNFQTVGSDDGSESLALQPSLGLGLNIAKTVRIDYALNNVGSAGNDGTFYSHIISLTLNIKSKNRIKERLEVQEDTSPGTGTIPQEGSLDHIEQID